ncbi:hypothetical protein Clacol_003342 [Clathrus columnatus]|uniref:Uncharacterized protein n=1 Tax=Clathrus columnatus TaxID=1419009 RepID=A0AAV5A4B7_9AGAM|nr:hypothetical protein Clacol_003342 [Clathrus columnatus]
MSGKISGINDLFLAGVQLQSGATPSKYDNRRVPRLVNRERFLHPQIHGFPTSWLELLKSTFAPTHVEQLHWTFYYPLEHQRKVTYDWFLSHPGQTHPAVQRWNLNSLAGGVEDNCHPPYPIITLIAAALSGAPEGKLTSKEVRFALTIRYNFFLTEGFDWHAEVDRIMRKRHDYFTIFPRKITTCDGGPLFGLRLEVAPNIPNHNVYFPVAPMSEQTSREAYGYETPICKSEPIDDYPLHDYQQTNYIPREEVDETTRQSRINEWVHQQVAFVPTNSRLPR